MRKLTPALVAITAATAATIAAVPADAAAKKYPGQGKCPKGGYQLCINGGPGNFTIKGKRFSGKPNAILLRNVSNVTISGNTFTGLKGSTGYAGVHIKNSTGIVVKNNKFTRLSNVGHMHGVYVVKSSRVTITGNTFSRITGDAVRLRDGVTKTLVSGNTITTSGQYAIVSEWGYIDSGEETCGKGNVVKKNKYSVKGNDGQRIALIEWGGWGGKTRPHKKVTFGHCKKPSITNGGGNKKI